MSSRFSSNSETKTSDLLKNLEENLFVSDKMTVQEGTTL